MSKQNNPVLQMKNITVEFPGMRALDDVSVDIYPGSVNVVMGENGAGKSTLMKVLIGLYRSNCGEILLNGKKIDVNNAKDAENFGISMIYQELNPVPEMTIAENIFLGREPTNKLGFVKTAQQTKMCKELLQNMEVDLNPDRKMKQLSVAETQMVEIVKAVSFNANIIIMDEPTSAITDKEVERLFEIIAELKKRGKAIIYISHKFEEIFRIADYITVLRDGKFIATEKASDLNKQKLIELMVGREINNMFPKEDAEQGDIALEVKNLTINRKFRDINFHVRKGEILGVSGLMGAGRTEVAEAIFGIRKLDCGEIFINGKPTRIRHEKDAIKNKMALVSEDRKIFGLNLKGSIKDNVTTVYLDKYLIAKQFINFKKERKVIRDAIQEYNIRTTDEMKLAGSLSGGNQQKVVIAKWLIGNPDIIILDEPTRGIDVGAKAEIHRMMCKLAQKGKAIIMISSELPEIIGMSDRVIVLHEGELTGELDRKDFSPQRIMQFATGCKQEDVNE